MSENESITVSEITCIHCETTNAGSRKFCRECGQSLWIICVACNGTLPVSEKFCGHCGENIHAINNESLERAREGMKRAQDHLEVMNYTDAIIEFGIVVKIKSIAAASLVAEAKEMIEKVREMRKVAIEDSKIAYDKALVEFEKNNYGEAVRIMESVPESVQDDEFKALRLKVQGRGSELKQLLTSISKKLKEKPSLDLLDQLDRVLTLDPGNESAKKTGAKLAESATKQAINEARSLNWNKSLTILRKIPNAFLNENIQNLLSKVRNNVWMHKTIRTGTHVDPGLVDCVNRLVKQTPDDPNLKPVISEVQSRFKDTQEDVVGRWRTWSKPPAERELDVKVEYFFFKDSIEGLGKLKKHKDAHASRFTIAIGLALSLLQPDAISVNLLREKKKGFMPSFGFSKKKKGKNAAVGIEIGQSAIKVVKLVAQEGQKPVLEASGIFDLASVIGKDRSAVDAEILNILAQIGSTIDLVDTPVVVSMPSVKTISRFCNIPKTKPKDLENIIKFEVQKEIPFTLDTINWDWVVFEEHPDYPSSNGLLISAAKSADVTQLVDLFAAANVNVKSIQTKGVALHNAIQIELAASIKAGRRVSKSVAFLDMGFDSTHLVLTHPNGFWYRQIPIGSNHITQQIARQLKLTNAQANKVKHRPCSEPKVAELYQSLVPTLEQLVAEISKTFDTSERERPGLKPASMFCTGGGSLFHGLLRTFVSGADSLKP